MENQDASHPEPVPAETIQRAVSPLRVWPALFLVLLIAVFKFVPRSPDVMPLWWLYFAFMGPAACAIAMLLWWNGFSRARWRERVLGTLFISAGLAVTYFLLDETMDVLGVIFLTIPVGFALFGLSAWVAKSWTPQPRTTFIVLMTLLGFSVSILVRNQGIWGDYNFDLAWRWGATAEERALAAQAETGNEAAVEIPAESFDQWLANPEWPGFRGPNRLSAQSGAGLAADWQEQKPVEVWRHPVGPAWSSFTVAGNLLFAQEQQGEQEATVCYAADTGKRIWQQEVKTRFFEPMAGTGPRATPTLAGDRLFVMGASGILQGLDPRTGEQFWQQDLKEIADREAPMWGFSSSPLVIDGKVIVHAGGADNKGVYAFDAETGEIAWTAPAGGHTYSSPQACNILGETYIAVYDDNGLYLYDPESGKVQLQHDWSDGEFRVMQPHMIGDDRMVLAAGTQAGTQMIQFERADDELKASEVWTSRDLKSDYNDFVTLDGYLYGFDGAIFTCVDLATGKRMWKRGRYGKGQVILLKDIARLLVISETGEVVLLEVNPEEHVERGSFKGLEGKTWNHPVVVGDRLFIRNGEEAACYRLPGSSTELAVIP
ncbi:MAG: alcohol dehydrogenase [Planctomyces sp.]|nr:alcohol dehydrogenase [Planctomyces sp.]